MKRILLISIFFLTVLATPCAWAGEKYSASTWSDRTTGFAMLAAYAWIDYGQSAGWVTPGGGASELNPILGVHPTRADMLTFGVVGMGLLYLATEILPEPWDRIVLDSAISTERFNIKDNVAVENNLQRRINAIPIIVTVRF